MIYTYTVDLPSQDPVVNKRAWTKLPRSVLLAPYLANNSYFVDYVNALDLVFDETVEAKIDALANIRNMWVTTKSLEAKSQAEQLVEFTDWGGPERATVVQQVNLLGIKLSNAGVISESAYRTIAKFLGQYWFEKGKASMMDFLNFCLGTNMTIAKLWTQDYKTFHPEGSPEIGAAIFDIPPGSWYPTTHVAITLPNDYEIDVITISKFFNEIANYNLVLRIVAGYYDENVVTPDSPDHAVIVAVALETNAIFKIQTDIIVLT